MFDFGFSEILLFSTIVLLVLGPERVPVVLRTIAKWWSKVQRLITNAKKDLEHEFKLVEIRQQVLEELQRLKDIELLVQQKVDLFDASLQAPHIPLQRISQSAKSESMSYHALKWHYIEASYYGCFSPVRQGSSDALRADVLAGGGG